MMLPHYTPQTWVDNETILDAAKMQHIEAGITAQDTKIDILKSNDEDRSEEIRDLELDRDQLKADLTKVNTELKTIENLNEIDTQMFVTSWTLGKIDSGSHVDNITTAYSDLMDTKSNFTINFDTTKYKLLYIYFDNNGVMQNYYGWRTTSPYPIETQNYPKFRLQLQTLDSSHINTNDLSTTTWYPLSGYVPLVEKVLNAGIQIKKLEAVYVDGVNGSNNNIGTKESPFKTIQKGVNSGSQIVYVKAGDYTENLTLVNIDNISIFPWGYPTYTTSTPDTPKIHITGGDNKTIYHGIDIEDCGNINIVGLWCDNTSRSSAIVLRTKHICMTDCVFSNTASGDYNGLEIVNSNGVFRNCIAHHIAKDGFNIHQYGNTEFIDCSAYDCGDDGISHHDGCTGSVIGGEYYNCVKGGVATPTYGAKVNVNGVYCHNNMYGLYSVTESDRRLIFSNVCNSVFKDNSTYDIYIGNNVTINGWNNIYSTKFVNTSGTFNELE